MPTAQEVERVKRVQKEHEDFLFALPNVVGVGTGVRIQKGQPTEEICVVVLVRKKLPTDQLQPDQIVPAQLVGPLGDVACVDVQETGDIVFQGYTGRYRPVQGGCSIGLENGATGTGTGGGFMVDATDNTTVMVTNNHVVSNDGITFIDLNIVQPSLDDGGKAGADQIGTFKRLVPRSLGVNPPVSPIDGAVISMTVDCSTNVLGPDSPHMVYGARSPAVNNYVRKVGRTTGWTSGWVSAVNMTVTVSSGLGVYAKIANAFQVKPTAGIPKFSERGDSGSLVYYAPTDPNPPFVPPVAGLHFAGNGTDGFACDIAAVMTHLNVKPFSKKQGGRRVLTDAYLHLNGGAGKAPAPTMMRRAELIVHRFHNQYSADPQGRKIFAALSDHMSALTSLYMCDDHARALMIRAIAPFLWQKSDSELAEARLKKPTTNAWTELLQYLTVADSNLAPLVQLLEERLAASAGKSVREFFSESKGRKQRS